MMSGLAPDIERILRAGNQAPSGENCQPWHFVVRGSTIEIHLLPERDQSAYSWGQRASYLAIGAVLENIVIASTVEGYRADITYLPNSNNKWHTATVSLLRDAAVTPDPLARFIFKRISNRKPYARLKLSDPEKAALLRTEPGLVLIDAPDDITKLGRVGSTNEEVMLANKSLHNFFFSHVNWTKEEDDKKKIGFYIKTLELPPPAQVMFKVFKSWGIMRILAALGFTKVVAAQNAATNASAGAIGALTVEATEPIDFVKIGRSVERVWLTATALGLALQPLTGVLFFKLRIEHGESDTFSKNEQEAIMSAYHVAEDIFKAQKRHIAFMFRLGRADSPSAQATRFSLEQVVTVYVE